MPPAESRRARARVVLALAFSTAAYLALHALAAGRVPSGVAADPVIEAMRGLRLVLLRRFEVLTVSIGPSAETLWLYVTGASVAALGPTRAAFLVPSILAASTVLVLVALLVRRVRPELPLAVTVLVPASSVWLFHSGQIGLRASAALGRRSAHRIRAGHRPRGAHARARRVGECSRHRVAFDAAGAVRGIRRPPDAPPPSARSNLWRLWSPVSL